MSDYLVKRLRAAPADDMGTENLCMEALQAKANILAFNLGAMSSRAEAAEKRERALLDSNQQERTALVEASSLRAELMRERKRVTAGGKKE
jgi:hypothetical protein